MTRINKLLSNDFDNTTFLMKKISHNKYFKWSSIHPYKTNIDSKNIIFKNSYEAHIRKHPLNKKEEYIWKNQLDDYPNNIKKSYIEFSNKLIKESNLDKWEYDYRNHSINYTNNDKIRVSLKRSVYNNNEAVISTCHPRTVKYNYSNEFNSNTMNYFNMCTFNVNEDNRLFEFIFKPSDSSIFREKNEEFEDIIDGYLIDVCDEINKLEYYSSKYKDFELSDAYDFEEITECIDRLFLVYTYNRKTKGESELYCELIDRLMNIDQYKYINEYINDKEYLHGLNDNNSFNLTLRKIEKSKYISSQQKKDFLDLLDKVAKEENKSINVNSKSVRAAGKSYEIDSADYSHVLNITRGEMFNGWQLFVICKHNKISLNNSRKLLAYVGVILPLDIMDELYNEWDIPYDDDKMLDIVEYIKMYKKPCK